MTRNLAGNLAEISLQSDIKTTATHLLDGRVKLMQPKTGYRIGMDGALLAAACASLSKVKTALELGCGVGGALLSLKMRRPALALTGIEREPDYAALARENIRLNNLSGVTIIEGDIGQGYKTLLSSPALAGTFVPREVAGEVPPEGAKPLHRFDLVFSNPPYFDDPDTLRAPHEAKRPAWIADDGLDAWLDFAQSAVVDQGHIVFIHRADRLADILSGLSKKCGSFVIRPIQPFADREAKRVLVRAQRLGKAPLRLLPPLILHDNGARKHTTEVESILRGEAELNW
ncbi:tRNA1(Val) (adenine(37)-N6)-methyltransferase [Asticcacaulis sp.]|uniref:tRNA1(Val) (adenine(37)-N6)-methyltransferase n=1 Tax=Asticcacaulis sp. TaxID=1872648 RepID=UPI003F7C4968